MESSDPQELSNKIGHLERQLQQARAVNERLSDTQDLLGKRLDQFVMLHYITKEIHDAPDYRSVLAKYLEILLSPGGFGFDECVFYSIETEGMQKITSCNGIIACERVDKIENAVALQACKQKRYQLCSRNLHLAMPLVFQGRVSAVIEVVDTKEIGTEKIQLLEIFALQTASVLINRKLTLNLEYVSYHDVLTGLYNRAYFEKEMRRMAQEPRMAGIIICDLDGLKLVNDILGHDAGDQRIQQAANILKGCVPAESSAVARIGGDEYAILLTGGQTELTANVCHNIRTANDFYNRQHPYRPIGISVGYAVGCSSAMVELYKQADRNMYRDKAAGGPANRDAILQAATVEEQEIQFCSL